MRVLICDQESEMLERIAREFEVDVATTKVTCIDLMRASPFDVVVASERLVDGSGLELLSSIATRWPDTLRVLAIEPERRKMLGGKLAPFRLHATIRYPIDEDELETRLAELDRLLGESEENYAEEEAEAAPPSRGRTPLPPQRPAAVTARPSAPSAPSAQSRVPYAQTRAPSAQTRAAATQVHAPAAQTRGPASQTRSPGPPAGTGRAAAVGASFGRHAAATVPPKGPKSPAHQSVTTKSYYSSASRAAAELAPPLVRRKPGSYTPLGAPEDADLRIVTREFDESLAPRAERAMRAREEAADRARTPLEKGKSVAEHVSRTLRRLLKR